MPKPFAILAATVGLAIKAPVRASDKDWDDAGSVTRDALAVRAFGLPAAKGDWDGLLQAGGSIGIAAGASYGLVFQVHVVDAAGDAVVRKTLRRVQLLPFFAKVRPCLVGAEACGTSHHWDAS